MSDLWLDDPFVHLHLFEFDIGVLDRTRYVIGLDALALCALDLGSVLLPVGIIGTAGAFL